MDCLFTPWEGIFPDMLFGTKAVLEISSLIAGMFYIIFALAVNQTAESLRASATKGFLYNILNGVFRLIEFLLVTRFLFKAFAASTNSLFVTFIYGLSNIIYSPFAGIIKDYHYKEVTIELSTILILVVVIIMDIAVDEILKSLFKNSKKRVE